MSCTNVLDDTSLNLYISGGVKRTGSRSQCMCIYINSCVNKWPIP